MVCVTRQQRQVAVGGAEGVGAAERKRVRLGLCILIHRTEGLRVQHLTVKACRECDEPFLARLDVSVPDNVSVHATAGVGVGLGRRLLAEHNGCRFVVTFGEQESSAVLKVARRVRTVHIQLRDPRICVLDVAFTRYDAQRGPRRKRGVVINNLCGKAELPHEVCKERIALVAETRGVDFGCVMEIATVSGVMAIKRDMRTVLVKGVSNARELLKDLHLLGGCEYGRRVYLDVHMMVLSGCLGVVVDVSLGCLLERTLQFFYKRLFVVVCRHEEASNHMEIQSRFSKDNADVFEKALGEGHGVQSVRAGCPCDVSLNISISRFGEALFRLSFTAPVSYSAAMDAWVRDLCTLYMTLFSEILSGCRLL